MTDGGRPRWWQRPSLHFLVFGSLLFGLWSLREPPVAADRVVVTPDVRARLAAEFERQRGHAPSDDELAHMVRSWALEEAQVREAIALGLAADDPVIRRRLVQKLGFVYEDLGGLEPLDDGALEAYRDAHAWRYAIDPSVDLEQRFLGPHADRADADEALVLAEAGRADPGVACAYSRLQTGKGAHALSAQFGEGFSNTVFEHGGEGDDEGDGDGWFVAESSIGWHLVRITGRSIGRMPELEAIRSRVEHDADQDAREDARDLALERLAHRYGVDP